MRAGQRMFATRTVVMGIGLVAVLSIPAMGGPAAGPAGLPAEMWQRVRSSQPQAIDLTPTPPPPAPAELPLRRCVELALRYNSGFRASQANLLGGREQMWVADQSLFYSVGGEFERADPAGGDLATSASASASARWLGTAGDTIALGLSNGTEAFGDLFSEQPALSLTYERPLLRGAGAASSRREQLRAAHSTLVGTQLAFFDARQDLVVRITESYFRAVLARGELDIAARAVERAKQFYDINRMKFTGEGLAKPGEEWVSQVREIDVSQAKLSWERAQQSLISQQRAVRDANDELLLAMGLSPGAEPVLTTQVVYAPQDYDEAQLCQVALANSTRLAALNLQRSEDLAAVRLARSATRPDLIASLGVTDAGNTLSDDRDPRGWFAGVRLEIPISDRSRTAGLSSARRRLQVFEQQQTAERESIVQEIKRLVRAAESTRAQIVIGEESLALAGKSRAQVQEMYAEGLVTYLDVLDAEDRLVEAERSLLRQKTDYFLTTIRLRRALGEDVLAALPS